MNKNGKWEKAFYIVMSALLSVVAFIAAQVYFKLEKMDCRVDDHEKRIYFMEKHDEHGR